MYTKMLNPLLIMSKPSYLIVFLATTLVLADYASAGGAPTKPNYVDHSCVNTNGNYTGSSTYQANLISVLSDLKTQAPLSFFSHTSAGLDPDKVYGQYYCRGDIDSKLCGECISQAAQSIVRNCTLFKTAVMWYEECTLRYSSKSMVGIEDKSVVGAGYSQLNAKNSVKLLSVLEDTFDRLITESTNGSKPSLFATGEGALSDFENVYCLVQCSPDLSGLQCDDCLRLAYTLLSRCCPGVPMPAQIGGFFPSCQLRYNSFEPFYAVDSAPPPPPGTPSSPPGTPSPGTPGAPNKGESVALRSRDIGVVMTAVITLLMVAVKM